MTDKLLKENITVFHKTGEDSDGKAIYKVFELTNVKFENRDSIYASNRGLKPYNGFKLYFVPDKSSASDGVNGNLKYISAISWDEMQESERASFWTVAENDLVSDSAAEITEGQSIEELCNKYTFYYVNSIIPCRGMGKLKLLEITGRGRSVDSD